MKKISHMKKPAWVLGVLFCTLGIALCTKAGLGLSMIAAPPYIIHVKLSQYFPFYTQGMSEYVFQFILLVVTGLLCRTFRPKWLLSFVTAVISGFALDGWFLLFGGYGVAQGMAVRVALFVFGELFTALAIAFYFRTDLPQQVYELLVAEVSARYNLNRDKVKMVNDISYLVLSVALALILNRSLQGVGIGTVVITLVNAPLIALLGKIIDKFFIFD